MSNMPDINKRLIGLRIPLELDRLVLKKFAHPGDDGDGVAYLRALEEVTRNIVLTAEDYEEIARQVRLNVERRQKANVCAKGEGKE